MDREEAGSPTGAVNGRASYVCLEASKRKVLLDFIDLSLLIRKLRNEA